MEDCQTEKTETKPLVPAPTHIAKESFQRKFNLRYGNKADFNPKATGSALSVFTNFTKQKDTTATTTARVSRVAQQAVINSANNQVELQLPPNRLSSSRSFASLNTSFSMMQNSNSTNTNTTTISTISTATCSSGVAASGRGAAPFTSTNAAAVCAVAHTICATPQDSTADSDWSPLSQQLLDSANFVDVPQQNGHILQQQQQDLQPQEQHHQQQRREMRMTVVSTTGSGNRRDSPHKMHWGYFLSWISCGCMKPQTS